MVCIGYVVYKPDRFSKSKQCRFRAIYNTPVKWSLFRTLCHFVTHCGFFLFLSLTHARPLNLRCPLHPLLFFFFFNAATEFLFWLTRALGGYLGAFAMLERSSRQRAWREWRRQKKRNNEARQRARRAGPVTSSLAHGTFPHRAALASKCARGQHPDLRRDIPYWATNAWAGIFASWREISPCISRTSKR